MKKKKQNVMRNIKLCCKEEKRNNRKINLKLKQNVMEGLKRLNGEM